MVIREIISNSQTPQFKVKGFVPPWLRESQIRADEVNGPGWDRVLLGFCNDQELQ